MGPREWWDFQAALLQRDLWHEAVPFYRWQTEAPKEIVIFFFFLAALYDMWEFSSSARELNPCPLQWKHRILTTGPPGKSQDIMMFILALQLDSYLLVSAGSLCLRPHRCIHSHIALSSSVSDLSLLPSYKNVCS